MLIKNLAPNRLRESDITPQSVYLDRRHVLGAMGFGAAAALLPKAAQAALPGPVDDSAFSTGENVTERDKATRYNNFYEFTTNKNDVVDLAQNFVTKPWTVKVDGLVNKPGTYGLDDILQDQPLERRIYRFRCVETWSMVVPWIGFSLADFLKRVDPAPGAKYVAFETLLDKSQMPGQRWPVLNWPYREGLRLDEAMHPLTMLVMGMYDDLLPNQNGAPLRLMVPWKYGFKSIKSIVRIHLTDKQPKTAWNMSAPREYGFYANVNPDVDHPRWSQAKERRLGDWLRRDTLPFNGYGDEVASLYTGMDLRKFF